MKLTQFKKSEVSRELELALIGDEKVDVRDLPLEDKKEFIDYCLEKATVTNSTVVVNLILVVLGGTLDNELFERDDIYFRSLMEYLDVKTSLKTQIDRFCNQLVQYFVGALKGYYSLLSDNKVPVPTLYGIMLSVASLNQMSRLFIHADFNVHDVPQIENSKMIIDGFCSRNELARGFMDVFFSDKKSGGSDGNSR